jgi:hypothetical protein
MSTISWFAPTKQSAGTDVCNSHLEQSYLRETDPGERLGGDTRLADVGDLLKMTSTVTHT